MLLVSYSHVSFICLHIHAAHSEETFTKNFKKCTDTIKTLLLRVFLQNSTSFAKEMLNPKKLWDSFCEFTSIGELAIIVNLEFLD